MRLALLALLLSACAPSGSRIISAPAPAICVTLEADGFYIDECADQMPVQRVET